MAAGPTNYTRTPNYGAERGVAPALLTPRLELRAPDEPDRARFVELFCDPEFMVFSAGTLDVAAANERFDRMLSRAEEFWFAKQPIVERASGIIVGYAGVDRCEIEGRSYLEYGYRLVPDARARGYATEAGQALLAGMAKTYCGELIAIIDPANHRSQAVARKLGFAFWKQAVVEGFLDDLYRLHIGDGVT